MKMELITTIVGILFAVASAVVGAVASFKLKGKVKESEGCIDGQNKFLQVYFKMLEFVCEAEKFYSVYSTTNIHDKNEKEYSDLKLKYVLEKIQTFCLTIGYIYQEELWKEEVARIVAVTNKVNVK